MALVPHNDDKVGKKVFDDKLAIAKKSGTKQAADKLKTENNIDLEGKPKIQTTSKTSQ